MKRLATRAHGIADYAFAAVLAAVPLLFRFPGGVGTALVGLAIVHASVSVATDYQPGLARFLPFSAHGAVELVECVVLAFVGALAAAAGLMAAASFTLVAAATLFALHFATSFTRVGAADWPGTMGDEARAP